MKSNLAVGRIANPGGVVGARGRIGSFGGSVRRFSPWLLLGAFSVAGLIGCGQAKKPTVAENKSVDEHFAVKVGDHVVQAQVVALPGELERGLMYRPSIGADEGMIFVFTQPQAQRFWMHDVTFPLDIGYFDASGELLEIYPMYPLDERGVSSRSKAIQYCLEMNQGWFARAGVKPGAKLDLKAVAGALRARGLKPEAAGLP